MCGGSVLARRLKTLKPLQMQRRSAEICHESTDDEQNSQTDQTAALVHTCGGLYSWGWRREWDFDPYPRCS